MNLVSLIMQFLAPAIINKMAGSLGIGQGLAGKAISAALPSILAALAGSASKGGGGAALASMLGKQDPGLLGNFASMLGGSGQQGLIDSGSSALSSLLGGGSSNAIASAVGKFAGINDGQSKSLLGMLAPVVLGTLAKEQKSQGLDANGLAGLLAGQKDNIASALPAGFSDLLKGSGVLDSISANLPKAGAERHAHADSTPSAPSDSGIMKYLLPLAAGAALLFALSGYGCNRQPDMKSTAPAPAKVEKPASAPAASEKAAPAAAASEKAAVPAVSGVELTNSANKALSDLMATLGGVKDEASAKSSLTKLQDLAGQFDKLKGVAMGMPAEARHPLVVMISGVMPGVATTIEKALAIPGVGAVLKPVLDQIAGSLGAIAKG